MDKLVASSGVSGTSERGGDAVVQRCVGVAAALGEDPESALPLPDKASSSTSKVHQPSSSSAMLSSSSSSSCTNDKKGKSRNTTTNSKNKSLSPWRSTLHWLRPRRKFDEDQQSKKSQQQSSSSHLPPSPSRTKSSLSSTAVVGVSINALNNNNNNNNNNIKQVKNQQSAAPAGGDDEGTSSSDNNDDSDLPILQPPMIHKTTIYPLFDPTTSTTLIAGNGTPARMAPTTMTTTATEATEPPLTGVSSLPTTDRKLVLTKDSIDVVLQGNGMAIPIVRTKSIIKRHSNVSSCDGDDDGYGGAKNNGENKPDNKTQRKSVSFCENSIAAAERDCPSSRNKQRKLWDNIMLAMPVILPYLIAILILILSCLVQPADHNHHHHHHRDLHRHVPSSATIEQTQQHEQEPPQPSPSYVSSGKEPKFKPSFSLLSSSSTTSCFADDEESITCTSGTWSHILHTLLPSITTKPKELENSEDTETLNEVVPDTNQSDEPHSRWYHIFSSKSTHDTKTNDNTQIKATTEMSLNADKSIVQKRPSPWTRLLRKIRWVKV